MTKTVRHSIILLCAFVLTAGHGFAQLNKITIDLNKDKPKKFENHVLRSEKTGDKKLTLTRKLIQNTTSHYNFYFNANNKINSVIERARLSNKPDYNQLLPYYCYSLANTAAQNNDLDSVIQKATAGILLHDLRTNWVDNFYMLIGKSYYFQKKFDSAYMAFQFINYNLYPKEKKKQDEQVVVGSNENKVPGQISIANKEDKGLVNKILSRPPERNEALVWQARSLIDMGNYAEAAGLINTLKNDPLFPSRLKNYLAEVEGYWFYEQQQYDSSITYLEQSIPNAIDLQDQAYREFLLGQLYAQKHSIDTAAYFYTKAIHHTTDPLMDIYANLHKAMLSEGTDPQELKNTVGALLNMARKDKYSDYRDIIYFATGELALKIPDTTSALLFYKRSAAYNIANPSLKNKAFLQLGSLNYDLKKYQESYNAYDSLQTGDTTISEDTWKNINTKKSALALVVNQLNIIAREDSLQQIAAMPSADREAFLKKLSKKLKKESGLKDYDADNDLASNAFNNKNDNSSVFGQDDQKGDWYFYNNSAKSKGYTEFKRIWGSRQNIDNWRRVTGSLTAAANKSNTGESPNNFVGSDPMALPAPGATGNKAIDILVPVQSDLSVEGLRANLPLTQPLLDSSNSKISIALFKLATDYQNLLEDYPEAIATYTQSLKQFPDSLFGGELYMNLSYCYKKTGNLAMADKYKSLVLQKYPKSKYATLINNPEIAVADEKNPVVTKRYDEIYNQFIEGKFAEAVKEKKAADSLYGKTYWTPQLLYIESVYYIKERKDSAATAVLKEIVTQYPKTPMSDKASNLMNVLSHRDSLENYLTNITVQRVKEDSEIVVFDDTRIQGNLPQKLQRDDNNLLPKKTTTVEVPQQSIALEKKIPVAIRNKDFVIDPLSAQEVIMLLTKVDPVYSSEARTAFNRYNQTKFYNRKIDIVKDTLDQDRTLLVFSGFVSAEDALTYMNRIKNDARGEISWLPADKYSFFIISEDNLNLLKENKKLESYLELLKQKFPDKF